MFEAIINRAQHSVESAVSRVAFRVLAAVPFVIAFGFGTAAATVKLVQLYGHAAAYGIVAGVFVLLGLVAAVAVAVSSGQSTSAAAESAAAVAAPSPGDAQQSLVDPDMLMTALGIVGPRAIPAIPALLRFAVRNWALVVSAIILAYMLMAQKSDAAQVRATGSDS